MTAITKSQSDHNKLLAARHALAVAVWNRKAADAAVRNLMDNMRGGDHYLALRAKSQIEAAKVAAIKAAAAQAEAERAIAALA